MKATETKGHQGETRSMKTNKSLILSCLYTDGRPYPTPHINININQKPHTLDLNKQGRSNPLPLDNFDFPLKLSFEHAEMLDLKTGYPTHSQTHTFTDIESLSTSPLFELPLFHIPKKLQVDLSSPPASNGHFLTLDEIEALKHNGNNALLFIHGYNIPEGNYGKYLKGYSFKVDPGLVEARFKDRYELVAEKSLHFETSPHTRTIGCKLHVPLEILAHFPALEEHYHSYFAKYHPQQNPESLGREDALINGTDLNQWFNHMEYNFNMAAGFDGQEFSRYTRIIRVSWPGNVGPLSFFRAENNAKEAGKNLTLLLQQLLSHQIEVTIIAHSLGCRVAMEALIKMATERGQTSYNKVKHLVLWQAALPECALESHGQALETVEKTIVLFSKNDTVLQTLYRGAEVTKRSWTQALGYAGPSLNESLTRLQNTGKLLCVDQTGTLLGHSHMKSPTDILMKTIYQQYILGGAHGVRKFGRFILSE